MHVATVIHFTDLHLFVDECGRSRPVGQRRFVHEIKKAVENGTPIDSRHWFIRCLDRVPKLRNRVSFASDVAWLALQRSLHPLLKEPVPLVVLQTGDVEAFGSGWDGMPPFAGFTALDETLRQQLRDGDHWFDIYGNHDIWHGVPPMPGSTASGRNNAIDAITRVPELTGPWPEYSDPIRTAHPTVDLQVLRVNTVPPGGLRATMASGQVLRHPPPAKPKKADTKAALADITARAPDLSRTTIRVALVHHPIHRFEAGVGKAVGVARLVGRKRLAARLKAVRIHMVAAGHRHSLDPAQNATTIAQPPLPSHTVQFVADSPTQYDDARLRSFSIYRLHVDDALTTLTFERHLARQGSDRNRHFQAPDLPDVVLHVPL